MAISATYYRYSNPLTSIRSLQAVPNASGLSLPTWLFNSAFQFENAASGIVSTTFSGTSEFGSAAAFGASGGGAFAALFGMSLNLITAAGGVSTAAPAPSGLGLFNGMADVAGTPFAINGSGQVFKFLSTAWAQIGTMAATSFGLIANSTPTLYTLQTAQTRLGTMTAGGVSGSLTTPMTYPTIIAASSGVDIAVGGWNTTTLASGFTAIAADPSNSTIFAGSHLSTSGISVWTQNASGTFAETQFVSGVGQNVSLAWSANGAFVMGADTTNNAVHVLTSTFGTLALSQTLTVTGAAAVAIALDSQHALVCQPGSNLITPLGFNGSTWATSGSTITIGNPKSVLALSTTQMLVGCTSGLATLTFSIVSGWNITSVVSGLGFVPSALAVDPNGSGIAATATSGTSGYVYYNGASGVFAGSASGVVVQQGQILTADPINSLYRIFANIGGMITQQASGVGLTDISLVANVGNFLFEANTTASQQLQWSAPYVLAATKTGMVSVYNGSTFSSFTLGAGQVPTAMAFDSSGNLAVATLANTLTVFSPTTSAALQQGPIPIFLGQIQTTPYGFSSLTWASGMVWATSSLNESIAAISGVTL